MVAAGGGEVESDEGELLTEAESSIAGTKDEAEVENAAVALYGDDDAEEDLVPV